jgi:hypothetical protein
MSAITDNPIASVNHLKSRSPTREGGRRRMASVAARVDMAELFAIQAQRAIKA